MNILTLFRRTPPDPSEVARARDTERELSEARGDLRNKVQTIQSHSRRINVMAGALGLKEAYDD